MRDHDLRFPRSFFARVPIVYIYNKSPRSAIDVKEIHRVRADAGKFRPLVLPRVPALRTRNDFPNGAATETACPKRKCLVKTIV